MAQWGSAARRECSVGDGGRNVGRARAPLVRTIQGVVYDAELADRIRELMTAADAVTEQKMFGGLAFLVGGNMAIAASGDGSLLVRVDPAEADHLVATTNAEQVVMRGRPMRAWLRVAAEDVRKKQQLRRWVKLGASYAASLPAKAPKSKTTGRTTKR